MENGAKQPSVVVIGLGYVGLPIALLADRKGFDTVGIDIDVEKVRLIQEGISPFEDSEITNQLKKTTLKASTEFHDVANADITVVCVPTPVHEDHTPNLKPLMGACSAIAPYIQKGSLVIIESTINPGVCDTTVIPLLEKESGLRVGEDFSLAHCPERINPGDSKWHVANINRVVGGFDKKSTKTAGDFYRSILDAEIKEMDSIQEAEAVKVVENAFRDVNIAFVNELSMSFAKLGIDVVNVINGAASKPFAFMPHYPGCGVGGHCIPVDPYYLIDYAKKNGFQHKFLSLARSINSNMPHYTVDIVENALAKKNVSLKVSRVAVLGVAYKSNIGDHRESPSFEIISDLESRGAEVIIFDPFVPSKSTVETLEEAMINVDAVVIATAHDQFKTLSPEYFMKHKVRVVIDGRNCLERDAFSDTEVEYWGIGRQHKVA